METSCGAGSTFTTEISPDSLLKYPEICVPKILQDRQDSTRRNGGTFPVKAYEIADPEKYKEPRRSGLRLNLFAVEAKWSTL